MKANYWYDFWQVLSNKYNRTPVEHLPKVSCFYPYNLYSNFEIKNGIIKNIIGSLGIMPQEYCMAYITNERKAVEVVQKFYSRSKSYAVNSEFDELRAIIKNNKGVRLAIDGYLNEKKDLINLEYDNRRYFDYNTRILNLTTENKPIDNIEETKYYDNGLYELIEIFNDSNFSKLSKFELMELLQELSNKINLSNNSNKIKVDTYPIENFNKEKIVCDYYPSLNRIYINSRLIYGFNSEKKEKNVFLSLYLLYNVIAKSKESSLLNKFDKMPEDKKLDTIKEISGVLKNLNSNFDKYFFEQLDKNCKLYALSIINSSLKINLLSENKELVESFIDSELGNLRVNQIAPNKDTDEKSIEKIFGNLNLKQLNKNGSELALEQVY